MEVVRPKCKLWTNPASSKRQVVAEESKEGGGDEEEDENESEEAWSEPEGSEEGEGSGMRPRG